MALRTSTGIAASCHGAWVILRVAAIVFTPLQRTIMCSATNPPSSPALNRTVTLALVRSFPSTVVLASRLNSRVTGCCPGILRTTLSVRPVTCTTVPEKMSFDGTADFGAGVSGAWAPTVPEIGKLTTRARTIHRFRMALSRIVETRKLRAQLRFKPASSPRSVQANSRSVELKPRAAASG